MTLVYSQDKEINAKQTQAVASVAKIAHQGDFKITTQN